MLRFPFRLFSQFALLGLLLLSHAGARAQGQPGNNGTTGGPPAPSTVPLDGGASLLLATGVAYGLRRLRRTGPAGAVAQPPA